MHVLPELEPVQNVDHLPILLVDYVWASVNLNAGASDQLVHPVNLIMDLLRYFFVLGQKARNVFQLTKTTVEDQSLLTVALLLEGNL